MNKMWDIRYTGVTCSVATYLLSALAWDMTGLVQTRCTADYKVQLRTVSLCLLGTKPGVRHLDYGDSRTDRILSQM